MDPPSPIDADEIVLRRVREAHMTPLSPRRALLNAFDPDPLRDPTGISVYRARFHSPADVAAFRTKGKAPCWVVALRAEDITRLGLTLVADPAPASEGLPARIGHALIAELRTPRRKSAEVDQWKVQLVSAIVEVYGGDSGFLPPSSV